MGRGLRPACRKGAWRLRSRSPSAPAAATSRRTPKPSPSSSTKPASPRGSLHPNVVQIFDVGQEEGATSSPWSWCGAAIFAFFGAWWTGRLAKAAGSTCRHRWCRLIRRMGPARRAAPRARASPTKGKAEVRAREPATCSAQTWVVSVTGEVKARRFRASTARRTRTANNRATRPPLKGNAVVTWLPSCRRQRRQPAARPLLCPESRSSIFPRPCARSSARENRAATI